MILAFIITSLLFISSTAYTGELEIIPKATWKYPHTGHTFKYSPYDDKDLYPRYGGEIEMIYWRDRLLGFYSYYGRDQDIRKNLKIGGKRYIYRCEDIYTIGVGVLFRHRLMRSLSGHAGFGMNYMHAENDYNGRHAERIDGPGPELRIGFQYIPFTTETNLLGLDKIGFSFDTTYRFNEEISREFNRTTFDLGGISLNLGIVFQWD